MSQTAYETDLDLSQPVRIHGVKGVKSRPFTKTFRNWAAFERWTDTDAVEDCEIYVVEAAN